MSRRREVELTSESVELLRRLSLHILDQTWVDSVWDSQFTERVDLPLHYETEMASVDTVAILDRLWELSLKIILLDTDKDETRAAGRTMLEDHSMSLGRYSYWTSLIEQNINNKNLIALLFHHISQGQGTSASLADKHMALVSSGLYFGLVGMPGSGAFKIFHPCMMRKALDIFRLTRQLTILSTSTKRKKAPQSQGNRGGAKRYRGSQRSQGNSQASNMSDEDEEDDDDPPVESEREQEALLKVIIKVLSSLGTMLQFSSLKGAQESLEWTVSCLVELVSLEQGQALGFSSQNNHRYPRPTSELASRAFSCLAAICSESHGDPTRCTLGVFKALLPLILLLQPENSDITAKGLGILKMNSVQFVKRVCREGGPDLGSALLILLQQAAAKVPDKADYRREAASTLVSLLGRLDTQSFKKALVWFLQYAHSTRPASRLFALEVLGKLLHRVEDGRREGGQEEEQEEEEEENNHGNDDFGGDTAKYLEEMQKFIFATIYERSNDSAASVRTQALKVLGDITSTQTESVKRLLQSVLQTKGGRRGGGEAAGDAGDWHVSLFESPEELAGFQPLPAGREFVTDLCTKAMDLSVFVRKSALQVLENMLINSGNLSGDLLTALSDHCRDPSMSVRKQMIVSLSGLVLAFPANRQLVNTWVAATFPMVLDVENKVGERAAQSIYDCLVDNLVPANKVSGPEGGSPLENLPWTILLSVEGLKMESYLEEAVSLWAKEGRLAKGVVSCVQSYTGTEHNGSAWMLLSLFTSHVPSHEPGYVLQYFRTSVHNAEGFGLYTLMQVVKVLKASLGKLTRDQLQQLKQEVLGLVGAHLLPSEVIGISVDVLVAVTRLLAGEGCSISQYQSAVDSWALPIIEQTESFLNSQIIEENENQENESKIIRIVFTLGELAQVCPLRISRKLFLLLQSVAFFKDESNKENQNREGDNDDDDEEEDEGPIFSQALVCRFIPSNKLKALSVICLGKMCIQNEEQAKKIIPAFGKILVTTHDPSIKNNIMFALSDMCVRYASLVDPLTTQMTTCLRDKFLVVRRTTLIQLIRLLQEDYLKIRGKSKFFLRILHTLLDKTEEITLLTRFYIEQRLLKLVPNVMYSCFLEAIFHFNDYQGHTRYNKFSVSKKEAKVFVLSGNENQENRRFLYRFMLEHMSDENRFKTTYQLTSQVLNGVVEGSVCLERADQLLRDTLYCLSCQEIKLVSMREKLATGEEEGDGTEAAENIQVLDAARKAVISSSVKKSHIEIIIPTVLALKSILENNQSPLVGDLFEYLKKMMEDYKTEVKDILAADPQLAKEIEYDLRKHEERRQEEEEHRSAAAAAGAAAEPAPITPGRASVPRSSGRRLSLTPSLRQVTAAEGTPVRPGGEGGVRRRASLGNLSVSASPASNRERQRLPNQMLRQALSKGLDSREAGAPPSLLEKNLGGTVSNNSIAGGGGNQSQTALDQSQAKSDKSKTDSDKSQTALNKSKTGLDKSQTEVDKSHRECDKSQREVDKSLTKVDRSQRDCDKSHAEVDKSQRECDKSKTEMDKSLGEKNRRRKTRRRGNRGSRQSEAEVGAVTDEANVDGGDGGDGVDGVEGDDGGDGGAGREGEPTETPETENVDVSQGGLRENPKLTDREQPGGLNRSPVDPARPDQRVNTTREPVLVQSRVGGRGEPPPAARKEPVSLPVPSRADPSPTSSPKTKRRQIATNSEETPPSVVESAADQQAGGQTGGRRALTRTSSLSGPVSSDGKFVVPTQIVAKKTPGPLSTSRRTVLTTVDQQEDHEADLNKSKRISGQGMPRQVEKAKSPRSRRLNMLRAASTPQINKTMVDNLTFNETAFNLSAITVLSPASSIGSSSSSSRGQNNVSSFRFGKRDVFDDLMSEKSKEHAAKKQAGPTEKTFVRLTSGRGSKESGKKKSSLDHILEDDDP